MKNNEVIVEKPF